MLHAAVPVRTTGCTYYTATSPQIQLGGPTFSEPFHHELCRQPKGCRHQVKIISCRSVYLTENTSQAEKSYQTSTPDSSLLYSFDNTNYVAILLLGLSKIATFPALQPRKLTPEITPTRCRNLYLKQFCLEIICSYSSDCFDYPYYSSLPMDAYQNLISVDKLRRAVRESCFGWLSTRTYIL